MKLSLTFASKTARLVPAAFALACASVMQVREPLVIVDAESAAPASLAADAVTDLTSHGDLLVARDTAFASDASDGLRAIERGKYAGVRVPVKIDAALRGKRSEHFWRLPSSSSKNSGIVGWRTTRYPIPVAFRHSRSAAEVSANDSAAFWTILSAMSEDVGITLFKPVTVVDTDPEDVIIVDVRAMPGTDGFTRATWTQLGELFDVRVSFGSRSSLHDSHIVTHEMTHALGFGHTNAWRSVVNSGQRGTDRLTPSDVAYIELAMALRGRRERIDMRQLIALAVERETPAVRRDQGYVTCDLDGQRLFTDEVPMRNRYLLPIGVLTVVSGCGDKNPRGPDTIAVPAAAIDTTTDRLPGVTRRSDDNPASGVDTPITRKLGSPAPTRKD